MQRQNEQTAYFSVTGNFDPAEITRNVGVEPTESWSRGDHNRGMPREQSRWSLHSRLPLVQPIERHIDDVLDQLDSRSEAFREIVSEHAGEMQAVGWYFASYGPIGIEPATLVRLAAYGLALDYELHNIQSHRREDTRDYAVGDIGSKQYAYFGLKGDFDPDVVTRAVGMEPTQSWRKGDRRGQNPRPQTCSAWHLRSRLPQSEPLMAHIADVVSMLEERETAFSEVSRDNDGVLELVGYFWMSYPKLRFERGIVALLSRLQAAVDCDFYGPYTIASKGSPE